MIEKNLKRLLEEIPQSVRLVAVTKTRLPEDVMEAYNYGHRVFGENKAQELIKKAPLLPDDIHWHFIGHLQTNKVKYLAPFVKMIESIDSLKLLKEVNKQARKYKRVIDCLLQFHIAKEQTKYGLSLEEADEILTSDVYSEMENVNIRGVMGMATFTDDENVVRNEFRDLSMIFKKLKDRYFSDKHDFNEISMGMSGDYKIAIEEGSTIVRIGTKIFGERE